MNYIHEPEPWESDFLLAFVYAYGAITEACQRAGVSEEVVKARIEESPVFARQVEYNKNLLKDMVRREAIKRAVEPSEVPIYQGGRLVGKRLEYDNAHLRWLAERLLPEEFHLPTRTGLGDDGQGEIEFTMEIGPAKNDKKDE